ncbi:MAG: hypothetical protein ABII98_02510 [bacterium]
MAGETRKKMKATFKIDPKNAVKIGNNASGYVVVEFNPADLNQTERDEIASCDTEKDIFQIRFDGSHMSTPTTADILGLRVALAERAEARKKHATKKAAEAEKLEVETNEAIEKWVTLPAGERLYASQSYPYKIYKISDSFLPYSAHNQFNLVADHRTAAAYAEAHAESVRLNAEAEREHAEQGARNKAKAEAKNKADAAAAKRRTAQIAAWVAASGTDNQKNRLRDGVLPDVEIVDLVRAEAYAPFDQFPRYQKLKNSDVCEGYEDYDGSSYHSDNIDFDVDTAGTLTAEQYDRLQEIKKAAPDGATVDARLHTGKCTECETYVSRIGFMVRLTVGELSFSREYGMIETETDDDQDSDE